MKARDVVGRTIVSVQQSRWWDDEHRRWVDALEDKRRR